jgi:hypothetical protein
MMKMTTKKINKKYSRSGIHVNNEEEPYVV